jgi:hypothetical protein
VIGRISGAYKKRYEHRVNVEWVGWNQSHASLTTLARFAIAQAEREAIEVGRVITRLLDNVFANSRLEPHNWPLKWVAEDPARYYLGESGGVARAGTREEPTAAEASGDPELMAIQAEFEALVDEQDRIPSSKRRAEIDARLNELGQLGRKRQHTLAKRAAPERPPEPTEAPS